MSDYIQLYITLNLASCLFFSLYYSKDHGFSEDKLKSLVTVAWLSVSYIPMSLTSLAFSKKGGD